MRRTLFTASLLVVLAVVATSPATAQLVQTVEVGSGGTPAANGAALLAAYAGVPASAGPAEPWVVKVDAGVFDLGGSQLVLRDFVDLEGSGRNATFIDSTIVGLQSNAGTLRVPTGVDAEIRNLTVRNGSAGDGLGIGNSSTELKLTRTNIEMITGSRAIGFRNFDGQPRLSQVFSRIFAAGGNSWGFFLQGDGAVVNEALAFVTGSGPFAVGVEVRSGSAALLEGVAAVVTGDNLNYGFSIVDGAAPRVTNCRATVIGGQTAVGFYFLGPTDAVLQDVTADASLASSRAVGLEAAGSTGATVRLSGARLSGTSTTGSGYGLRNGNGTIRIDQSVLVGSTRALANFTNASQTFVGATRLDGGVTASGILRCAQSYDGNYFDVGPGCV
jgi:hypothetical protein